MFQIDTAALNQSIWIKSIQPYQDNILLLFPIGLINEILKVTASTKLAYDINQIGIDDFDQLKAFNGFTLIMEDCRTEKYRLQSINKSITTTIHVYQTFKFRIVSAFIYIYVCVI